ncbi:outer membrane lipoprotein carrier protein LolA [Planctomycetota bacterium]
MRPAENIEKLIKRLRYTTSDETHDRVLGNVLQALDKREEQKSGSPLCFAKRSSGSDLWRTIMNNKMRKFAAAAAIIVAVLIGWHYLGGSSGTVYADVVEQLQKARTLLYTVTSSTPVEGISATEIEVAFKEPGYMRMSMPGGYITVMDWTTGKGLSIIPPRNQFLEMELGNMPDDAAQREFDAIERLRTLPDRADEHLGERIMDGRTVQGFRVNEGGMTNTVWIDPKTRELVLVEMESTSVPGISGTMSDFQFNVELEEELFSLTPPDGYSRMDVQVDASALGEKDLIEFLRLWSSWTKDHTFPPTLHPIELQKVSMEMEQQGKFGMFEGNETSEEDRLEHAMKMARGMVFVTSLPAESNWHYAGENVKYGDAQTPIFWHQPTGSQTYRVIYGDLSVKDVAPEDLP